MLLTEMLATQAHNFPERLGLVDERRSLTFGELHDRVQAVARAVAALTEPGSRVAILAENRTEYVECYYGVPASGSYLTVLNYRLHPEELAWILQDAGVSVLIAEEKFLDGLEPLLDALPNLHTRIVLAERAGRPGYRTFDDVVAHAPDGVALPPVNEDDPAWLMYTSGTTGKPKGVVLTHRNVLTAATSGVMEFATGRDERMLLAFPLCHVAATYLVLMAHLQASRVVLMRAFESEQWMALVHEHQVVSSALAPTMIATVLDHPNRDRYDLSTLGFLMYATSTIPAALLERAIGFFGPILCAGYGTTEAAGGVMGHPMSAHARAAAGEKHLLNANGRPQPLVQVRLADTNGAPVARGEVGEIQIRGPQVTIGYWRGGSVDTSVFLDGGWLPTGDLARADDEGFFYIVDRIKDMIITGGENVYSREVEEVIRLLPGVLDVAVVGVPDPVWGERVVAAVVAEPGAVTEEAVVETCRAHLGRYKVPKEVHLVDELPRNSAGKVLKRSVRDAVAIR